jgi:hypothetical protein
VRKELEQKGDVEKVTTSIDSKGRRQPSTKQSTKPSTPEKKVPGSKSKEFASAGNDVDTELSAETRRAEMAALAEMAPETKAKAAKHNVVKLPPSQSDSAIQREWRAAERAFEDLARHTPRQVAKAISPDKAALVTEFANYFTELTALLKPDAKPAIAQDLQKEKRAS